MTQWITQYLEVTTLVYVLKDGQLVFSIEEERLSRKKYDGGPYGSMIKILDYTDRLDYLVVIHNLWMKAEEMTLQENLFTLFLQENWVLLIVKQIFINILKL